VRDGAHAPICSKPSWNIARPRGMWTASDCSLNGTLPHYSSHDMRDRSDASNAGTIKSGMTVPSFLGGQAATERRLLRVWVSLADATRGGTAARHIVASRECGDRRFRTPVRPATVEPMPGLTAMSWWSRRQHDRRGQYSPFHGPTKRIVTSADP